MGPEQLENERVRRPDVQELLSRVVVEPAADLTAAYRDRTAARVRVVTHDGRRLSLEQSDYEGSPTRPLSWSRVVDKFHWLAEPFCGEDLRGEIIEAVGRVDEIAIRDLTALLSAVSATASRARSAQRF